MKIREYSPCDLPRIAEIFKDTIACVCNRDYTLEQLAAWAAGADEAGWDIRFKQSFTLVAEEGDSIIAFGSISGNYLDMLYADKDFQGRGAGTALCDMLESACKGDVTVEASVTARPFFAARGYVQVKRQSVERSGVKLDNFVMIKRRQK